MKDFLIVGENLASGQWCHQTKPNVVSHHLKQLREVKMPKRSFIEDEGFGAKSLFLSLQNPDPFQK